MKDPPQDLCGESAEVAVGGGLDLDRFLDSEMALALEMEHEAERNRAELVAVAEAVQTSDGKAIRPDAAGDGGGEGEALPRLV